MEQIRTRAEIPIEDTWAIEDLYVSDAAWEEELATLAEDKTALQSYSGRLNESAQTLYDYLFMNEKVNAKLELLEEPVYVGCGNDEWSVRFKIVNSNLGEDEEFYATLIDEKRLILQHLYPFDGTQGVSYQTYISK